MIRYSLRIFHVLVLFCIANQSHTQAQMAPSTNQPVQIYLTLSGPSGSPPVPTLSQLSVAIDKQPARLTSLRSANADKMLFALLVDTSTSEAKQAASIRETALQLFQGLSEGGNEGYLVIFDHLVSASKKPVQLSEARQTLGSLKFGGGTALLDAIAGTCTRILSKSLNPETPRRAIFMLTDGEDNSSHINHSKAEEIAEGEGVAIFSLQTGTTGMSSSEAHRAFDFLKEASLRTGGQAFQTKKVEEGIPLLLKAVHEQWILAVVPNQPADRKSHTLTIENSEKSVEVSAPTLIFLE